MTVQGVLEQYQVADFIDWNKQKRLTLNPIFQRRSVWTPDAKSYLIETLLRRLPMPKVYMRTTLDTSSQSTVRDIVDGQQRLRAILEFAGGQLTLTKRGGAFAGQAYSDLTLEQQNDFLGYRVSVEQLVNASDDDVLEVFSRLNSYTVVLNDPEQRHAKYQGDFKWAVREEALRLGPFWGAYQILSTRDRLRMLDDSLTAEMFGVLLEGVRDGGQARINQLYTRQDKAFPNRDRVVANTHELMDILQMHFDQILRTELFSGPPHFLMLFAATAHAVLGIPRGDFTDAEMPVGKSGLNVTKAQNTLARLANVSGGAESDDSLKPFLLAALASTQRFSSRRVRFLTIYDAITG